MTNLLAILWALASASSSISWQTVDVYTPSVHLIFRDCVSSRYSIVPNERELSVAFLQCDSFKSLPGARIPALPQPLARFKVEDKFDGLDCGLVADTHINETSSLIVMCGPPDEIFRSDFEW